MRQIVGRELEFLAQLGINFLKRSGQLGFNAFASRGFF